MAELVAKRVAEQALLLLHAHCKEERAAFRNDILHPVWPPRQLAIEGVGGLLLAILFPHGTTINDLLQYS